MLCERMAGERRVAVTPEAAAALVVDGHLVVVESGAGTAAGMSDEAYLSAGATVVPDLATTLGEAGVVVSVNGPTDSTTLGHLGGGHILIGLFDPFGFLMSPPAWGLPARRCSPWTWCHAAPAPRR